MFWCVMSSLKVTLGCRLQAQTIMMLISVGARSLHCDGLVTFYIKYFGKLCFLTFQLWMSTEIWNFHYYLMKSIMDNWHFVRSVQLCMNVHLAEESSRDSSNNAWPHISSHLSPAAAKMIFLWPKWPPFILSGFRRHREALGGSDLMLEKF